MAVSGRCISFRQDAIASLSPDFNATVQNSNNYLFSTHMKKSTMFLSCVLCPLVSKFPNSRNECFPQPLKWAIAQTWLHTTTVQQASERDFGIGMPGKGAITVIPRTAMEEKEKNVVVSKAFSF